MKLTEKYQVLPSMPPEQFEALKADIAERGLLTPLDVDEDGNILDGHHRYRACLQLGITDFPTIVRPGMSEQERRIFARKSNTLRRHLTRDQVRFLIGEQLKDTPNWANNRIGQLLGVDDKTVASIRRHLEATSEIPKFDRLIGADGKERSTKRPAAVMAHNVDELAKIIAKLAAGASFDDSFSLGADPIIFIDESYNPFAHCEPADIREWKLFILFGIHSGHVEWILQKQFKNPAEWLGEEGTTYRQRWLLPSPQPEFLELWETFRAKHKDTPESELESELEKRNNERKF